MIYLVNTNIHLDHILFGNLLGIENHEMRSVIPLSICLNYNNKMEGLPLVFF